MKANKMTIAKAIEAIENEIDYITNHISVKDREKNEHLKGMKAAYQIALEILEGGDGSEDQE